MTHWIFAPALLFVLVLLVIRIANKQARARKDRQFRTNYFKKKSEMR